MSVSTVERGRSLETDIAELFRQGGYTVEHNAKMRGRSGAAHQIDVLASYDAPFHKSTVLIEAKNHRSNIDKDTIMKLAAIRDDLSAGHAILATTSGFTPGALRTASVHGNLDLWDGQKTAALLGGMRSGAGDDSGGRAESAFPLAVPARVSADEARAAFEGILTKRARGGFMGRGKIEGRMTGMETVWRRYYDIDLDAEVRVVEKTGWRSREAAVHTVQARVTLDATTGAVVSVGPSGLSYGHAPLAGLDRTQLGILKAARNKKFEKREISLPGLSSGKVGQMINDMAARGVIVQTSARPATYRAASPYPADPSSLGSIGGAHSVARTDVGGLGGDGMDPGAAAEMAGTYWDGVHVKSIDLVYYPYHVATVEYEGGAKRTIWVDAVTGSRCAHLEA